MATTPESHPRPPSARPTRAPATSDRRTSMSPTPASPLARRVKHLLPILLVALPAPGAAQAAEPAPARWLLGRAYKIPAQYTNQESGYFSIVAGHNGRLYIGAAKYGVNAYLIEFDPKTTAMKMVMDVHQVIGSHATGFAAQAKLHTRNNVGASGKIYVGSKQGY